MWALESTCFNDGTREAFYAHGASARDPRRRALVDAPSDICCSLRWLSGSEAPARRGQRHRCKLGIH
jgi:hypothetical protein